MPILADEVGGQFSLEEQFFKKGRALATLPDRLFVIYRPNHGADICATEDTLDAIPEDARILREQLQYFSNRSFARPAIAMDGIIRMREQDLIARVKEKAKPESAISEQSDDPGTYYE